MSEIKRYWIDDLEMFTDKRASEQARCGHSVQEMVLASDYDALATRLAEVEKERDERRNNFAREAAEYRGVDIECVCGDCNGMGVKAYGSTATWHGGIGGAMITRAVCDKCWGSGDRHRPWADIRKMEQQLATLTQALAQAKKALERIEAEAMLTADPLAHLSIIEREATDALAALAVPAAGGGRR